MATPLFTEALAEITATLQAQFPDLADALSRANAIIANDGVVPEPDGRSAKVRSQSNPSSFHLVNGACDCASALYRPGTVCGHRMAWRLWQKVMERLAMDEEERWEPVEMEDDGMLGRFATLDPQFVVRINDKPFVKFAGLLQLAHKRGLQELRVEWTHNDAELSLAQATAVFPFGTFADVGDASPGNTNPKVRAHFRRVAGTRAAARALRLALGVEYVAAEELGEEVTA